MTTGRGTELLLGLRRWHSLLGQHRHRGDCHSSLPRRRDLHRDPHNGRHRGPDGLLRQNLSVANTAPTNQLTAIQCTLLACTGTGTGTDPEGGALSYSWDTGTGAPAIVGSTATWSFPTDGSYSVTLSVTNDSEATTNTMVGVIVNTRVVAFRDQVQVQGNTAALAVPVPASVLPGDALVMVVSINTSSDTLTTPTGWTVLGEQLDGNLRTRLLSRVAVAGDAGSVLSVSTQLT